MLKGRYEPGAVAAVIANSVNIDVVVRVAGLIIDLEINFAPKVGAEGRREPLNRGGMFSPGATCQILSGVPDFWFSSTIGFVVAVLTAVEAVAAAEVVVAAGEKL